MQQLVSISIFALASAALMVAQSEPAPVREGGYWTRTVQGAINASGMERLRVETVGNVQVRGAADQQAGYTLKVRVKAADAREAEALLRGFTVKTGTEGGWAYHQGHSAPPGFRRNGIDGRPGRAHCGMFGCKRAVEMYKHRTGMVGWKRDRAAVESPWTVFGAAVNCGRLAATFKWAASADRCDVHRAAARFEWRTRAPRHLAGNRRRRNRRCTRRRVRCMRRPGAEISASITRAAPCSRALPGG